MSIEALKWAWEQQALTPAEKLVLLCLADHADDLGENCYPSQERIAKKTGVGRESVSRAIRRFSTMPARSQDGVEYVGILQTVKQRLPNMGAIAFNKYKLLLGRVTLNHTGVTKSHGENVTKSHSHVTGSHTPCDNLTPGACDDRSHNPSEENRQKIEPSERGGRAEKASDDLIPEEGGDLGLGEKHPANVISDWQLWGLYEAFMAEVGKPMSVYSLQAIGLQLIEWRTAGGDPRQVILKNLGNRWRSLRFDADDKKPPGEVEDMAELRAKIKRMAGE